MGDASLGWTVEMRRYRSAATSFRRGDVRGARQGQTTQMALCRHLARACLASGELAHVEGAPSSRSKPLAWCRPLVYRAAVASTPEIDGASVVLLGSFNPAIFQPEWIARHELIAPEEADAAEVQIISREVTQFSTDLFDIQVTSEQFIASTARAPRFEMLQDLVLGIFDRLRHTPIARMGLNRDAHFQMSSEPEWHSLGHRLVDPELWRSMLKSPGMRALVVQGERPDERSGSVFIRVEPSRQVHPGVYMQHNDHFEFGDSSQDATAALAVLRQDWSTSLERAEKAFTRVLSGV